MTDIKISSKTTIRKKRNRRQGWNPARMFGSQTRTFTVRSSWTDGAMASGTTGAISYTLSPSIANSSEYSTYQALYTEVKLLSFRVILTPTQATNGLVNHSRMIVSTNMLMNMNSLTNPSSYIDVQNEDHAVRLSTLSVTPLTYYMSVPALDYANIVGDPPSPPTPWAGSPGLVRFFANGLTASTVYFQVDSEAVWKLRGRQ